jgi:hypothetical protein
MAKVLKATKQLGADVPIIGESFEKRQELFVNEVNAIGEKHQIALRPQLVYRNEGIVAVIAYIDKKEEEKAAKKAAEAKTPNKPPTG